jgi:hypothetical protein
MRLANDREAMIWILKNQFNRRNLDVLVKIELNKKLEELYRKQAEKNAGNHSPFSQDTKQEKVNKKLLHCNNYHSVEGNLLNTHETNAERKARWNSSSVDAQVGKTIGISREQYRRGKKVLEDEAIARMSMINNLTRILVKLMKTQWQQERTA